MGEAVVGAARPPCPVEHIGNVKQGPVNYAFWFSGA